MTNNFTSEACLGTTRNRIPKDFGHKNVWVVLSIIIKKLRNPITCVNWLKFKSGNLHLYNFVTNDFTSEACSGTTRIRIPKDFGHKNVWVVLSIIIKKLQNPITHMNWRKFKSQKPTLIKFCDQRFHIWGLLGDN